MIEHIVEPNLDRRRSRSGALRPALGLFVLLLIAFAYFFPRWADWNENSHFALVQAIVDEHTFIIDDYYQSTGDYAIYGQHRYTDKAPGLSFLAAPVYAAFRLVEPRLPPRLLQAAGQNGALAATLQPTGSGLQNAKIDYAAGLYVVTFFVVSLPSALLWVMVFDFLGAIGFSGRVRLITVLACALGTVAFPYSSVFYSHQLAAFLSFAAFYLLFQIKRGRRSGRWLWLVGAIMGLGVLTDFPSVLPSAILCVYAASFVAPRWTLGRIVGGGAPFALALGWYNAACFGSPFASSYRYLALFQAQSNYGFLGFSAPTWTAFWGITFSSFRGLFFSSPFLLLLIPGAWAAWRVGSWRPELRVCLSVVAAYIAFISCYYDWKGGFAIAGPRNLITLIPFAAFPVAWGLRALWSSALARAIILAAFVWSLAAIFVQTAGGQAFAPITISNPLFEFFLPRFLEGDVNRNLGMLLHLPRWYSLAPLFVLAGLLLGMIDAQLSRGEVPVSPLRTLARRSDLHLDLDLGAKIQ